MRKKLFALAGILAVIAFLVMMALWRGYARLPRPLSLTVQDASFFGKTEQGSVIIDHSSTRLLFLDTENKIISMRDLQLFSRGKSYYSAARLAQDGAYIGRYTTFDNSCYLKEEHITKYTYQGERLGRVLQLKHTFDKSRAINPVINDIYISDKEGAALCVNPLTDHIRILTFAKSVGQEQGRNYYAYKLEVLPKENNFVEGAFAKRYPSKIILRTNKNAFYQRSWKNSRATDLEGISTTQRFQGPYYCSSTETAVALDIDDHGKVVLQSHYDIEGKTLAFTTKNCLCQLSFWLASLYFLLYLLFMACYGLRKLFKEQRFSLLKELAVIVAATVFCLGIVGFYSTQLAQYQKATMSKFLRGSVLVMDNIEPKPLLSALKEYRSQGTLTTATNKRISKILEESSQDMSKLGYDMIFGLLYYDANDNRAALCASTGSFVVGKKTNPGILQEIAAAKRDGGTYVMSHNTTKGRFVTGIMPQYDEQGQLLGVLYAECDVTMLNMTIFLECLRLLVMLLSAVIMLSFIVLEGDAWLHCFLARAKAVRTKMAHPEFYLSRPLKFLDSIFLYLHGALLSIMIAEMPSAGLPIKGELLVAVVLSIHQFGAFLGGNLFYLLSKKIPEKPLVCGSIAGTGLAYLLAYFSILQANIVLFTVALFLENMLVCISASYLANLTFYAPDKEALSDCNRSRSSAMISGYSVSVFLAGFVATNYGNASVELVGFFTAVVEFCFILFLTSSEKTQKQMAQAVQTPSSSAATGKLSALLMDRMFLAIIFCVTVPQTIVIAYKTYLFPLFAMGAGIDKATISNICVFCNALVFYSAPLLRKSERKLGTFKLLVVANCLLAATFMMFVLNSTVVWAIACFIITTLLTKTMGPAITTSWQQRCLALHTDTKEAFVVVRWINSSIGTLRSTILGCGIKLLGRIPTCFSIGVYCALCSAAFAFMMRKNEERENCGL